MFKLLITEFPSGRTEPYFRPRFLGDKSPTFDFLVELVGAEKSFFFVQVKTTQLGYRGAKNARRLRVSVDREDVTAFFAIYFSPLISQHNGVQVRSYAGSDMGIDLLVELLKDGKPAPRFFGVQLVPYLDLPDDRTANERVLSHTGRDPSEATLPVCVFVIGVRKLEGIYRWVVEPVIEEGRALLVRDGEPNWQVLDEAGAARLIDQVNAWYDALQRTLTPKRRERRAKDA
jgi:hypothetical protein